MLDKNLHILIVGLGLIGGSYARALTRDGYRVSAIDRDPAAIAYALGEGILSAGAVTPDPALLGEADLVVLALYPHTLVDWVREHQGALKPGAVLTDVTGVKGEVVYRVQACLRQDLEFIAAHPMAGRELPGVQYSTADLFRGANYLVVPTPKNTPGAIALCRSLGQTLGCARVTELTPESHDEMIGFVSQLPHCIAVALMIANDDQHLEDFEGDSFRDLTRIAKINDELWSELFLSNRRALIRQIDEFLHAMEGLRSMIAEGDREGLRTVMRRAHARRAKFEEK